MPSSHFMLRKQIFISRYNVSQGEEIGMTNNMNISFEETQDPSGIRCGPDHYQECSRDPVRTPLQWNSDDNTAGFSSNRSAHTWLPVNADYLNGINVKVRIGKIGS